MTSSSHTAQDKKQDTSIRLLTAKLMDITTDALREVAESMGLHSPISEFALQPLNPVRVVLALSGGRDSMAMLDILSKMMMVPNQCLLDRVTAVYIHHGLSEHADEWKAFCEQQARKRGIPFDAIKVKVDAKGKGVEGAARQARYEALYTYARTKGYDIILTAHHQDDRLETFLLQWMRGAGPEGIASFPVARVMRKNYYHASEPLEHVQVQGSLLIDDIESQEREHETIVLLRPWIQISRSEINAYVRARRMKYVEDESNADERIVRNKIRRSILPALEKCRPGFRKAASRSIDLVAEAVGVLQSVAEEDLDYCLDDDLGQEMNVSKLLQLPLARQAWTMRAWLTHSGTALPNKARLDDLLRQLRESNADSMVSMQLGDYEVRRWGSTLKVVPVQECQTVLQIDPIKVQWTGQSSIELPEFEGELIFEPAQDHELGISESWLRGGKIEIKARQGGERMKLFLNRPTKTLKDWFAQAKVPSYERMSYPLLWIDDQLVYVSRLGIDVRLGSFESSEKRYVVKFRKTGALWESDSYENFAQPKFDATLQKGYVEKLF